jgi:hypothetical protein
LPHMNRENQVAGAEKQAEQHAGNINVFAKFQVLLHNSTHFVSGGIAFVSKRENVFTRFASRKSILFILLYFRSCVKSRMDILRIFIPPMLHHSIG